MLKGKRPVDTALTRMNSSSRRLAVSARASCGHLMSVGFGVDGPLETDVPGEEFVNAVNRVVGNPS